MSAQPCQRCNQPAVAGLRYEPSGARVDVRLCLSCPRCWCGNPLAARRKFCSHACYTISLRGPRTAFQKPCEICGSLFTAIPANAKRGWDRFCSKACSHRAKVITPSEQIRQYVDTSAGQSECWPWTSSRSREGYGVFTVEGKQLKAHRVAWELANGTSVPDGLLIRHLCEGGGNPWCCNPSHLAPGTVQDNTDDKVKADRHCFGERNGRAKLTVVQVREIRAKHQSGSAKRALAREYGITHGVVHKIVERRLWRTA